MKKSWFKEWGWVYRPVSWQGYAVTVLTALFLIHIFLFLDRQVHSVSDLFYHLFPYWVPAIGIWLWIASKTK